MKIPSGLSKEGDLGTARDREGPYYGTIHIRLQILLVNPFHFGRDSFLGIKLYRKQKSRAIGSALISNHKP